MNTIEKVKRRLEEQLPVEPAPNQAALEEAERLSDLFSNVKVVPYRVPVERFIGVSYSWTDETEHFA